MGSSLTPTAHLGSTNVTGVGPSSRELQCGQRLDARVGSPGAPLYFCLFQLKIFDRM